ncbi:MAG: PqqD family peptide modification chaperone [Acidobacteria bacterium]|nr:PqqD family peptide modification chaperone [Acidobacteriota bacterium]
MRKNQWETCVMRVFTRKLLPCRQIESYSVIHLGERKVFLNPSGTGIWNLIDGVKTTEDVALAVAQQLNAPAEKVAGKVTTFLESLYERGLLWLVQDDGRLRGISIAPTRTPEALANSEVSSPPAALDLRPVQEICMTPKLAVGQASSVEEQVNQLYWENHYIQKMHVELTYRCNFRCVHCYNTTHGGAATELTTEEWFDAFDQLAHLGCYLLTLTGGELFVRKDVVPIIQHACSRQFALRLNTNGSLIDEKMLEKLEPMRPFLQSFDVSFYGADEKVHDTLAQRPGSYNNTMRAIRLLSEAKHNLVAKFVTMRDNFEGIDKFTDDMTRLGIRYVVHTGSVIPQTDRNTKPLVQILTDAQYRKLVLSHGSVKHSSPGNCKPGHVRGAITPEGHISPCEWLTDFKYGNLREQSLRDIWYSSGFLEFRKVFEEESECPPCSLRPGCDRCPAHSYLETGSLLKCAPVQRHNAEIFQQVVGV